MDSTTLGEIGRWFEEESTALVLYARQWLDPALAEDAVQDVFVSLMQQAQPPSQMKPWLYRAVRHRAFKHLRARRRRVTREERVASEGSPWFEPRPDDAVDAQQAELALRALPAEEREVVTLRLWGGLTLAEIAAVTECSLAAVFRRYHAALERVRQQLGASCLTKIN
ncbi:MAG: sigma-70 family RNA polymerase sigma factor [Verrucomicrobia bacterium]|nr:sigma-70 family RNA polymerase sigma factor [Verrucomicrobiota bacterium]